MSLRIIGDVHGHVEKYVAVAAESKYSIQVGDLTTDMSPRVVEYLTNSLNPDNHKYFGGNHDDYTLELSKLTLDDDETYHFNKCHTILGYGPFNFIERYVGYLDAVKDEPLVYNFKNVSPHCMGNFGNWTIPEFGDVFHVRGAWSIDGNYRRRYNYSWFPREQLSSFECMKCMRTYQDIKPDVVLSHDAPLSFIPNMRLAYWDDFGSKAISNNTNRLLQELLEIHRPKLWVFGHYHQKHDQVIDGTRFVCLNQCDKEGWYIDL